MAALVLELQRAAIDDSVGFGELLRKALVVATKLDLTEFKAWVECELKGYERTDELPVYREIHCEVKSNDPFIGGTVNWNFPTSELKKTICRRRMVQGIASLEQLLSADGSLILPLSPEVQQHLMKHCDHPEPPTPFSVVERGHIRAILDAVRNTVLEWGLKLEAEGILGNGMTFTSQEKEAASRDAPNLSPSVNIFCVGQVSSSQIQQGTVDSTQSGSFSSTDLQAVSQLIQDLKTNLPDMGLADDDERAVESDIATIEAQVSSPRPKIEFIKVSLRSLRNIVEGVAGGGIIEGIKKLLVD